MLQLADARLKSQPEVARVLGKAGRADSPTDAAPLSRSSLPAAGQDAEAWLARFSPIAFGRRCYRREYNVEAIPQNRLAWQIVKKHLL